MNDKKESIQPEELSVHIHGPHCNHDHHHHDQPVSRPKIGRNDPCSCGSGKKYKKKQYMVGGGY